MFRPRDPEVSGGADELLGEGADHDGLLSDRATASEQRTAAFSALFRAMHPELRHFVLRRGGPEIVDDVVAEAFVVVWRRWDDAPADPSRRRGWVYGIVKHKLAHALRDRDRHLRVASRVVATAVIELSDPGDDLASLEEAQRVLDLLPRAERDAVELAVLAGLTTLEVAEALQCSATAVTSRLSKARGRLRRLLAAEGRSDHVLG